MKKWIFSTFILTMAFSAQPLRADGEIDAPPAYTSDSELSQAQKNQIFSVFSVYREKKDQKAAIVGIAGLDLNTRQMTRMIDEINAKLAETDTELFTNLDSIVAKDDQVEIIKSALERMQFAKIAALLKRFKAMGADIQDLSSTQSIGSPNDSKIQESGDLKMTLDNLKKFTAYVKDLPTAEQVELMEGALNQLELTFVRVRSYNTGEQGNVGWERKKSDAMNIRVSLSILLAAIGGGGSGAAFYMGSSLYRPFSHWGVTVPAVLMALASGGTVFFLTSQDYKRAVEGIANNEKHMKEIRTFIEDTRADLADLKDALKVNGGEVPTAEAEVSASAKP